MAIQGTITSCAVPDIFSLLLQQRKTGVLTIVRGDATRSFLFSDGNLVNATTQDKKKRLGSYLVRLGFVDEAHLPEIFRPSDGKESYAGQRIVESGHVTEEQLWTAVKTQISEIIEEVFDWEDGAFHFDDTPLPFEIPGSKRVSCQSVMVDVLRRRDERSRGDSGPSPESRWARVASSSPYGLSDDEGRLLELADGSRTLAMLAAEVGGTVADAGRKLLHLERRGFLRTLEEGEADAEAGDVEDLRCVPVRPEVAAELFAVFHFAEGGALSERLAPIVATEPVLAARLLAMLDLGNVKLAREDLSIERILDRIGSFDVRTHLVAEALRGFFFPRDEWVFKALWVHSQQCAALSRKLADVCRYPYPDEAYVAGLIHNVGAFSLLQRDPAQYARIVDESYDRPVDIEMLEEQTFGISHTALGAKLASRWSFPVALAAAIRGHHVVSSELQSPIVYIVAASSAVLQERGAHVGWSVGNEDLIEASLEKLDLDRETAEEAYREMRRGLDLSAGAAQLYPGARRRSPAAV